MNFVERLFEILNSSQETDEKPSIERTNVDAKFVGEAVNSYINENAKNGNRLPMDGEYYTCSKEDIQKIVDEDQTNRNEYKEAEYDCENFAFSFMANAQKEYGITTIGLVIDWSGGHAYNIFVYEDGSVELYEPQSDTYPEPDSGDLYEFDTVRVII